MSNGGVLPHEHHIHGAEVEALGLGRLEVLAGEALHRDFPCRRGQPLHRAAAALAAFAERHVLHLVVPKLMAARLRLQHEGERAVAVDLDGLKRIHLHGDLQRAHRASPAFWPACPGSAGEYGEHLAGRDRHVQFRLGKRVFPSAARRGAQRLAVDEPNQRFRQPCYVTGLDQKGTHLVLGEKLADSADGSRHDGYAMRQRLHHRHRQGFVEGGQYEHVRLRQKACRRASIQPARHGDPPGKAALLGEQGEAPEVAVTGERCAPGPLHHRRCTESRHEFRHALAIAEPPEKQQMWWAVRLTHARRRPPHPVPDHRHARGIDTHALNQEPPPSLSEHDDMRRLAKCQCQQATPHRV